MSHDYDRVARAIEYIDDRARDQPPLEEVAAAVGLSPHHFHRLFRRWAGLTPKRFLQLLTLEEAKRRLDDSRSVLHAAYAAGLSGPGRLHDLFVGLEGVTPGEYRSGGADVDVVYGLAATPFGSALVGRTARGICHLSFMDHGQASKGSGSAAAAGSALRALGVPGGAETLGADGALGPAETLGGAETPGPAETLDPDGALGALRAEWPAARLHRDDAAAEAVVAAIFAGDRAPLDVRGTNFQARVWQALLSIPEARVTCYEDLAVAVGRPGAARAVAGAVARNRVAWLIPCHRVIRKVGETGGYRWGSVRKRAMLAWEAAREG